MSDTPANLDEDPRDAIGGAKKAARAAASKAVESGQKGLEEALDAAERVIRDAAGRIEKAVREGVETVRDQASPYRDEAGKQIDEAQQYVLERVKERPVTATLAGLGVGLLIGLLLASRSSK